MADTRKVIDCRNFPSDKNCSLAISGTEDEVLDLAVLHASTVHGHENTPELREQIRSIAVSVSRSLRRLGFEVPAAPSVAPRDRWGTFKTSSPAKSQLMAKAFDRWT